MDKSELIRLQNMPLASKVELSIDRICEFYERVDGNVYVAFSGGKDSTALLHLVREMYPEVPAVFVDTGLEYPEVREFVKTIDNVIWLRPAKSFKTVVETYGFPVFSKTISMGLDRIANSKDSLQKDLRMYGGINPTSGRPQQPNVPKKYHFMVDAPFKCSEKCCYHMKKAPMHKYEHETGRRAIIGTMAADSRNRESAYLKTGCNAFDRKIPISTPIAVWKQNDIWDYISKHNIKYSKIYDMGESNTGCMFCMFGVQYDGYPNRFQRMKWSHPRQYKYCIINLGLGKVLRYMNVDY